MDGRVFVDSFNDQSQKMHIRDVQYLCIPTNLFREKKEQNCEI